MLEEEENVAGEDVAAVEDDEPPWGATMEIGGETYAVSLFWQPLQDPDNPVLEIRETAEGVLDGADVYVVRSGGAPQYGLGLTEEGHAPSQIAAAISLTETFSDKSSFVSVFKVEEGWWFLAVRNDLILSEEDVLYLNEEDAQRAFFSMMAVPDWGVKIAPEEWGIEGTKEADLEEILRQARPSRLVKLGAVRGAKFMAIVGVIALIVLWGLYQLVGVFMGGDQQARIAPMVAPKIFKKQTVKQERVYKPWEKLKSTHDVLVNCTHGIRSIVVPTPGWEMNQVTCDGYGVSTQWTRTYGRISWLKEALQSTGVPVRQLMFDEAGAAAVGVAPLSLPREVSSFPIMTKEAIIQEANEIFQAIGMPVSIAELTQQMTVRGGLMQRNDATFYPALKISFESDLDPLMWEVFFQAFQAMEIISIVWDPVTRLWGYEGVIYERPIHVEDD